MEKKIVMRVDLPEGYAPGQYYECVCDIIIDCVYQLNDLYHDVAEKGFSLHGHLFTITGTKDLFAFNAYAMEEWIRHGGTAEDFLSYCRVLESVEQRVEDVLDTLKCGYQFERMPKAVWSDDEESVGFMCKCPCIVQTYGLKFGKALIVDIYNRKDGTKVVEYGCSKELYHYSLSVEDIVKAIMEKSGLNESEAGKVFNSIESILETSYDAMFEIFGREFEERLPDVDIIDRAFTSNFLHTA